MIELGESAPPATSRTSRLTVATLAAAGLALLMAVVALARPMQPQPAAQVQPAPPAVRHHTVVFGVAGGTGGTAEWIDSAGRAHRAPWNEAVTIDVRAAVMSTSAGPESPASCTLVVDGSTVDTDQVEADGLTALCMWAG